MALLPRELSDSYACASTVGVLRLRRQKRTLTDRAMIQIPSAVPPPSSQLSPVWAWRMRLHRHRLLHHQHPRTSCSSSNMPGSANNQGSHPIWRRVLSASTISTNHLPHHTHSRHYAEQSLRIMPQVRPKPSMHFKWRPSQGRASDPPLRPTLVLQRQSGRLRTH